MKKFLLPALFFLCVFPAFSQVGGVSAPFVSRLEAEVKNGFIRLSWDDSPDIRGPVYVYRSETPMTSFAAGSLPNPARVPYGTESYLDEAEKPGTFYYFAVASDEQGEKYMLFTATVVVTVKEGDVAEFFRDPSLAGAYTPPPPPPPGAAEQGPAGPMPEDDVNAGNFAIRRGSSAAGAAATAARGTSAGGFGETPERPVEEGIRTVPLPRMNVDERGAGSTAGSSLSPAVSAALSSIGIPEKTEKTPVPVVFPEDLEKISSGERYQLSLIVQGSFNDHDWNKAAGELKRFLDLPRSERGAHKARFYLGQCYYFSGKSREALFEFLAAREYFPDETGPWLRAVLTGLPEQSGK